MKPREWESWKTLRRHNRLCWSPKHLQNWGFLLFLCNGSCLNTQKCLVWNSLKQLPVSLYYLTSLQEQYVFLHQAVMEALTCGNTEVAPQDLRIAMNKLARTQKSSKQTGYEREFKVLPISSSSLMFFLVTYFYYSTKANDNMKYLFCFISVCNLSVTAKHQEKNRWEHLIHQILARTGFLTLYHVSIGLHFNWFCDNVRVILEFR